MGKKCNENVVAFVSDSIQVVLPYDLQICFRNSAKATPMRCLQVSCAIRATQYIELIINISHIVS